MNKETLGEVIAIKKQRWLKVNTKPIRAGAMDGAIFPHIIKVSYKVDGTEYKKSKWIRAGNPVPALNSHVKVIYSEEKPSKAKIML